MISRTTHSVSLWARRHVFLFDKKTRLAIQQEDLSSCSTKRHVFLFERKHVFLLDRKARPLVHKKTCLLAEQEDLSFLLFNKKTCLLVGQDVSTTRHVFLLTKKTFQASRRHPEGTQETPRKPGTTWRQHGCFHVCVFFGQSDATDHFRIES